MMLVDFDNCFNKVDMYKNNNNPQLVRVFVVGKNEAFPSPKSDDLYLAMRSFLIFGQCLGIVPLQGLGQNKYTNLGFQWRSWQSVYNVGMTSVLILAAVLNLVVCLRTNGKNPSDLAWSANMAVYYSIGAFNYQFFLRKCLRFVELFKKWSTIGGGVVDRTLLRDTVFLSGLIYTFCIMEHAFSHLKFFPVVENAERRLINEAKVQQTLKNASVWETYYWRSHPFLPDILPYNVPTAILFFLISKFAIFAWDFGDILICVVSRALYFKFKLLLQQVEKTLEGKPNAEFDLNIWLKLAAEHEKICLLVVEVDQILSPLIFATFGVNIYYLCLQLNLGLTPSANTSTIAAIYATWSFMQLLLRLLAAAIPAAQINTYGHRIWNLLRKCPTRCYSTQLERTERFLANNSIGLTGLSCFTLTRPFILNIVSVVFTFEIVLLQSTPAAPSCG